MADFLNVPQTMLKIKMLLIYVKYLMEQYTVFVIYFLVHITVQK
jgi:hypothetical protein